MDQSLPLKGRNVAILVTNGFEQVEMTSPRDALEQAGASVSLISEKPGAVQGMNHDEKANTFEVDYTFDEVHAHEYDAVVLPGGVINSDHIRTLPQPQAFVKDIAQQGKPIAVICHGAWLLVSAGLVQNRRLTSWPSLRDDIINAGGRWVDHEVEQDGLLVSSRKPDDLPAFNQRLISVLEAHPPRNDRSPALEQIASQHGVHGNGAHPGR